MDGIVLTIFMIVVGESGFFRLVSAERAARGIDLGGKGFSRMKPASAAASSVDRTSKRTSRWVLLLGTATRRGLKIRTFPCTTRSTVSGAWNSPAASLV